MPTGSSKIKIRLTIILFVVLYLEFVYIVLCKHSYTHDSWLGVCVESTEGDILGENIYKNYNY